MAESVDIAVIGGGLAGLTAAQHAALSGATTAHVMGSEIMGGLVVNIGALDGFAGGAASGVEVASALFEAGATLGIEQIMEDATAIESDGRGHRIRVGDRIVQARQVILATGARLKSLGVPGEKELTGRGVSQCAWCDGGLHKGKPVVVIGGGDAALQEALHLAELASQVTIVTRGERFRARQSYVSRVADNDRIALRWMCDVRAILGSSGVEAVRLIDQEAGREEDIACHGAFVFVGLEPAGALAPPSVARDATGALVVDGRLETAVPGLFAVGAVRSGYSGRLNSAVGEATSAAVEAARRCGE